MSCTQTLCHVDNVGALVPLSVVHAHGSTIDLTIHRTLRIPLYSVVQLPQYQVAPFSAGRPSPRPPRHAVSVIGAHTTGSVRWVAGSHKPVWKKGLMQPTTASEGGHSGCVHDLWGWLLRVRRVVQYPGGGQTRRRPSPPSPRGTQPWGVLTPFATGAMPKQPRRSARHQCGGGYPKRERTAVADACIGVVQRPPLR